MTQTPAEANPQFSEAETPLYDNIAARFVAQRGYTTYKNSGDVITHASPLFNLNDYIINGQSFIASGRGVTVTTANIYNVGLSMFNPLGSGTTLLLYSLKMFTNNNATTLSLWTKITTDIAGNANMTAVVPINVPGVTAPTTLTSCAQSTTPNSTSATISGTKYEDILALTTTTANEILQPGFVFPVIPGTGLVVYVLVGTAGNYYQASGKWVEAKISPSF